MSILSTKFTPEERVRKARAKLLEKQPFFGYLSLRLSLTKMPKSITAEANKLGIQPTMCVDYQGHLFYDDDFVASLKDDELECVVAHETMHLAFSHDKRFKAKPETVKRKCWNIATDMVINDILLENGFNVSDKSITSRIKELVKYKGMSSEEIYRDLLSHQKLLEIYGGCGGFTNADGETEQEKNEAMGEGDFKSDKDRFSGSKDSEIGKEVKEFENELKQLKEEWNEAVLNAAELAHRQGKLSGSLEKLVDIKLAPEKVDWRRYLYRFIQQSVPQDFTWSKPSKKSAGVGAYLPSILREELEIIVSIDVSGSVDDTLYIDFLNELFAIARAFNRVRFTIISSDADVKHTITTTSTADILETLSKRKGYGGTDFCPAFEWALENAPNCKAFLYFTDGQGTFPNEEDIGDFKTLWIYAGNFQAKDDPPFGDIIRIEYKENGNGNGK